MISTRLFQTGISAIVMGSSCIALSANAEGLGYVELTFGSATASNHADDEKEYSTTGSLKGVYAYRLDGGHTFAIEGLYRNDTYPRVITDNEKIEPQTQIGLHYLYDVTSSLKIGALAGYGSAPHDDDGSDANENENYKVSYGGIQSVYDTGSGFHLFGQLAYVDSASNDNLSSTGYDNGYVARLGVTYTGFSGSAFTIEAERGKSSSYEDHGESGDFGTFHVGGVTNFGKESDWAVTYGARGSVFDALDDPDIIKERTYYVGIRYAFGGKQPQDFVESGLVGVPYLPLRASVWTPAHD